MGSRRTRIAALLVCGLILAGCTGGDDDAPGQGQDAPATSEPEETAGSGGTGPDDAGDTAPQDDGTEKPGADDEGEPDDGDSEDIAGEFTAEQTQSDGYPEPQHPGSEDTYPVEVRVGQHEGFDRVVMEYTGDAVPGWYVEYTDDPVLDDSGREAEIDPSVFLRVVASGLGYPPEASDLVDPGAGVILGVEGANPFEGHASILVGLDEERPYRVGVLEEPTRMVIDIATH